MTPAEEEELDIAAEAAQTVAHGMKFLSFPIPDRQVPESETKLTEALEKLDAELAAGRNVVLHCRQGIGRTGLVAACLLLTKGLDPESAVKRLSAARGASIPETSKQRRWIDMLAGSQKQADQLFFDQIVEAAMGDDDLRQAAFVNPEEKFELVTKQLIEAFFAERMDQNERHFLDNNIPAGVARILSHHSVSTSPQMGWTKVQNGMLLAEAESAGFAVMVTVDQNITYQQDLAKRTIALVVLGSNTWPIVSEHTAKIVAAVDVAQPASFEFIEMPLPPKHEREIRGND